MIISKNSIFFGVCFASPLAYELNNDFIDHIKPTENGGPAKARNIVIEKVIALNAEHLLFTDHDCILDKDWNEQMTTFLSNTEFGDIFTMD